LNPPKKYERGVLFGQAEYRFSVLGANLAAHVLRSRELPEGGQPSLLNSIGPSTARKGARHVFMLLCFQSRSRDPAFRLDPEYLPSTDPVAHLVHPAREENSVRFRHAVNSLRLTLVQGHKGMRGTVSAGISSGALEIQRAVGCMPC
jgi:hypothetical protein